MKKIFLSVLFIIISLICPSPSYAQKDVSRPAITIINPVRGNGLGHKQDDLLSSLKAQWQATKEEGVHATWLFQYGALESKGMTDFAKQEMKGQEFGLLFEIDDNFAKKAGVQFRGQGAWYFSDGLLLISYDAGERRRLIDSAFSKFKETFGYYPKTVGAWWIGGDSISYMQQKYGITASLRAADQFNLDFYSIWGTPWDIPYLASKDNEGMPGASYGESSKVVLLQWAIRDPLKGYVDPIYSLQDYTMKGYTEEYADYLASIYLQKPFGNMVMGLENGGTLEQFEDSYKTKLTIAKDLAAKYNATIELAKDYAAGYLRQKKVFAGNTYVLSTGFDSNDQSFWYVSGNYRAAIHKVNQDVSLIDLRDYSNKSEEDFGLLPNTQSRLRITEPAIVDSVRFPDQRIHIRTMDQPLTMKEAGSDVTLYAGSDPVAKFSSDVCTVFGENNQLHTYTFRSEKRLSLLELVMFLYVLYFCIILLHRKNIRSSIKEYALLILPFCFAYPFFVSGSTFLFDKKETFVLLPVVAVPFFSVLTTIYFIKIFPICALFVSHYLLIIKFSGKAKKLLYDALYIFILFLYLHVPYFPLDKTTYGTVSIFFGSIIIISAALLVFMIIKRRPMKAVFIYAGSAILVILILATTVILSRSKLALTRYEIDALQFISSQKKDVVYVEQADYSIRPIYKAVKPVLYNNIPAQQYITGKKWEQVTRPEDHILKLSHYENKIIVIPRYLGSDLSDYEVNELHLEKIFDNAQIAIFRHS